MFKSTFFWVALIFLVLGLGVDFFFDEAEVVKTTQTVTDVMGKATTFDIFAYSSKFKFIKLISNLFYTLGISIIVYFAIEYRMDEIEKKKDRREVQELQSQINLNIFNGVLKKLIPEELFDIIVRDILNVSIVRKNAEWNYEIKETESGYVLTQVIQYELLNISNQTVPVPVQVTVHNSTLCNSYFQYFKIEKDGNVYLELNREQIAATQENIEKGINNTKDVEIRPKETVYVTHTVVNEYSSKCIQDAHFSIYSIIGLRITVDRPVDCEFTLVPTFTEKLNSHEPTPTRVIYNPIKGILVGQSVLFIIEKKNIC